MKRVKCKPADSRSLSSASWSDRELRLVERLATVHQELARVRRDRAALVSYVWRLHGGSLGAPDPAGGRAVQVDTAAGSLSWRIDAEDTDLLAESGGRAPGPAATTAETLTRLSFLHLHRRANRPTRYTRNTRTAGAALGNGPSE
ncbi:MULTISPECIES: hypothetical protein [unclassified Streptomyces]|uniref:hypothetical protein n=1 Tax=unclassified Streptomyces TaxID=2593676 RepID=UPI0033E42AC7